MDLSELAELPVRVQPGSNRTTTPFTEADGNLGHLAGEHDQAAARSAPPGTKGERKLQ
jgi:hypothetical protein